MSFVYKMQAFLGLDDKEYRDKLDDNEKKSASFGEKVGKGLATVGKLTMAAVGAAATGVAALTKQSIESYANYEQLWGGVQKLYGTAGQSLEEYAQSVGKSTSEAAAEYAKLDEAQNMMLENAKQAYKTAGMSASDYMENATSFSAALINSLGGDTVAAAEQTDVAMRAISDNFNTFGGDAEAISGVFSALAKGQFMTLDNLKLGYAGSKEGMQSLIDDANEYAKSMGMAGDLTIDSFSDMVTAIDLIQQKQGIAGTTAREAATTIAGSIGMLKSSWENLVTGITDPDADLGVLFDNVADSAVTAFNNLVPAIERALSGIGKVIDQLAPVIGEKIPSLMSQLLPTLVSAATGLVNSLAKSLPAMFSAITSVWPKILPQLINALTLVVQSLAKSLPVIIKAFVQMIPPTVVQIADAIVDALPELIPAIMEAIVFIAEELTKPENIMKILEASVKIMVALGEGLIKAVPQLLLAITTIFTNLLSSIGVLISTLFSNIGAKVSDAFSKLSQGAGEGTAKIIDTIVAWLTQLPEKMAYWAGYAIGSFIKFFIDLPENLHNLFIIAVERVKDFGVNLKNKAFEIGKKFFDNLVNNIKGLPNRMAQLGSDLVNAIMGLPSKFMSIGSNIVKGIWNGISGGWSWLVDQVKNLANSLFEGAKNALGIHSPSTKFAWVGEMSDRGWAGGIKKFAYLVTDAVDDIATDLPDLDVSANVAGTTAFGGGLDNVSRMGYNQVVNIYSPEELSPSEVGRQTRNATRDMVLKLSGV